ncbi:MAG: winged helix-turn-helix domain-containing protein [Flavobacteriales bacterium]|jgi:DNA-binding winged helix-turn-helix (wHTH) protein|nr:winged helix-turn-helix domain-containing protein [Flavobacteriales bacterium]
MRRIILLFIITLATLTSSATQKEQHTKVVLRAIADEFLLQIKDSTSRILPINNINGKYVITFEKEFSFEPDLLLFSTFKVLEKTAPTEHYIVEVKECNSPLVIHSFQTTPNQELAPCKHRALPLGCYTFFFTEIPNPTPPPQKNTAIYLGLFLLIALTGGFFYFKKQNSTSNLISIGEYQLSPQKMTLIYQGETMELSNKETNLLTYFHTNIDQVLEREEILNIIWGDNGNYIGRTLDVYVSKLRKKLQHDTNIKIINIRGVGYKFTIDQ